MPRSTACKRCRSLVVCLAFAWVCSPASAQVAPPPKERGSSLVLSATARGSGLSLRFANTGTAPVTLCSYVSGGNKPHYEWTRVVLVSDRGESRRLVFTGEREETVRITKVLPPGSALEHTLDLASWAHDPVNGARSLAPGRYRVSATYEVRGEKTCWNGKLQASPVPIEVGVSRIEPKAEDLPTFGSLRDLLLVQAQANPSGIRCDGIVYKLSIDLRRNSYTYGSCAPDVDDRRSDHGKLRTVRSLLSRAARTAIEEEYRKLRIGPVVARTFDAGALTMTLVRLDGSASSYTDGVTSDSAKKTIPAMRVFASRALEILSPEVPSLPDELAW